MIIDVVNYETEEREIRVIVPATEVVLYDVIRIIYTSMPKKCYFFHFHNANPIRLVNKSKIIYNSIYYLSAKCTWGNILACKGGCLQNLSISKDIIHKIMEFLKPC